MGFNPKETPSSNKVNDGDSAKELLEKVRRTIEEQKQRGIKDEGPFTDPYGDLLPKDEKTTTGAGFDEFDQIIDGNESPEDREAEIKELRERIEKGSKEDVDSRRDRIDSSLSAGRITLVGDVEGRKVDLRKK